MVAVTSSSPTIYPYNKGGKEKRLYELSTRLAAMGHDVHIYTMHWWKSAGKSRVENGVHLHAISNYHEMYNGQRRSIKEGILFGLACFKLLSVKFDVLDVDHMPFFPVFSAWVVCVLRRKRLYATWHEVLSRKDWTAYMGVPGNVIPVSMIVQHDPTGRPARFELHDTDGGRCVVRDIDFTGRHGKKIVTAGWKRHGMEKYPVLQVKKGYADQPVNHQDNLQPAKQVFFELEVLCLDRASEFDAFTPDRKKYPALLVMNS